MLVLYSGMFEVNYDFKRQQTSLKITFYGTAFA
jgi:hypothetical protein